MNENLLRTNVMLWYGNKLNSKRIIFFLLKGQNIDVSPCFALGAQLTHPTLFFILNKGGACFLFLASWLRCLWADFKNSFTFL